ncbi:MAG: triose-phosphate isomerase, partial [Gammaproteobacteria bacterium]|nr:triose-phosphate isomerase [Gammaproteobacteria bacterium]
MRKPMVAGNWKMNGSSESVKELMAGIVDGMGSVNNAEVVVCPPAVYISRVAGVATDTGVKVGSQNI